MSTEEKTPAPAEDGWFYVRDGGFPEYGWPVLVVDSWGEQAVCSRASTDADGEHWDLDAGGGDGDPEFVDVIAWRPLFPKPAECAPKVAKK